MDIDVYSVLSASVEDFSSFPQVLDEYVAVKISEALYEMNQQLQITEAHVKRVMADKEKLEKLMRVKVQMIRVSGYSCVSCYVCGLWLYTQRADVIGCVGS